jgi:hypothetical protein
MSTTDLLEYLAAHESTAQLAVSLSQLVAVRAGRDGAPTATEAAR